VSSVIDKTICIVDSGLFTELAIRLAREFREVRSHVPWAAEFPTINDRAMGSGLPAVQWIEDPYLDEVFETTDIYMFPDIFRAGDQQLLERAGKLVWGSHTGDDLETRRIWFRKLQEKLGMPVPEYEIVTGMTELERFLEKFNARCFVKTTSKIRGSFETQEIKDFEQSQYWLLSKRLELGAGAERVQFMVEMPIDTPFETGIDTHCIDGQFPKTPMQGIEIKGNLILSSAQTKSPTPKPLDDALSILAPELKKRRYRNFLSAEFRGNILTDFCARAPNPGIGVEMEMTKNLGEIIYRGAQGELVESEFEFEFGIQAAIFHGHDKDLWKQFRLPEDLRRWVKLMEFCQVEGLYQIIPRPPHGEKIGWLLGVGDSIEAAAKHLFENAERLKDYPFDIKTDALEEAVKQAHEMEKQGMEFTDQPLPEPAEVIEDK
jgi:hypothetical protein